MNAPVRPQVPLGEFMLQRGGSTNPAKLPDEQFVLYSIPAFDVGKPEIAYGRDIGSPKKNVQSGDVLLSRIVPHIRRSWIVEPHGQEKVLASGEWIVFRSAKIHAPYLRHFLVSDSFHPRFMGTVTGVGGSLLRASQNQVADICIPLPPIDEQRRIAAILDKADALRRMRKYSLTLINAASHSLFEDCVNEFSRGHSIPLGKSLEFITTGGRNWSKYFTDIGSRFIRSLDVQMNAIVDGDVVYVDAPDNAEARRTRTKAGDVLLTVTGSRIGRASYILDELAGSYVSQHVAILRPVRERVRSKFLSYFLCSPAGQRQIAKWQYGQTKPGLNFDQIRRFEIPAVEIEQQMHVEKLLRQTEALAKFQDSQATGLEKLFSSLQHRAFSGQL